VQRRAVPITAIAVIVATFCAQSTTGEEPPKKAEPPVVDLRAGQQYEPGTRLRDAAIGVSWTLPPEWLGGIVEGTGAFVMGSNTQPGVGMVMLISGTTAEKLAATLNEPQDLGDGVVLVPAYEPEITGDRVGLRYTSELYDGFALALVGPHAQGVIYFFAGPRETSKSYTVMLQALASSTRFSKPETAAATREWNDLVAGMMLKQLSSYSSGTSGGYTSESVLHLCRDGSYSYYSASSTSIYVDGATGSGIDEDASAGRWRIEMNGAQAILVLEADDGGASRHQIAFDGEKTFVDGERVFRVPSDACP
jgi:hypothetical protein